jgi:hypothetical protein
MKLRYKSILCLLFGFSALEGLSGCSNLAYPYKPITPPTVSGITGNWSFSGFTKPDVNSIIPYTFGGSITNAGGQLSGVWHVQQPCFGNGTTDVPVAGLLNTNHQFQLVSSSVEGQILTLTGTINTDESQLTNGSFTVVGGCSGNLVSLSGPNGPRATFDMAGQQIFPVSGAWSEAARPQTEPTFQESLTESPTANAHGDFALTGTVTVSGSPCFTHGTLQPGSFVSGAFGIEIVQFDDGSVLSAPISFALPTNSGKPTGLALSPAVVTSGDCNGSLSVLLQPVN